MEQRINFEFDFQRLTDLYLGGNSTSWQTCFNPTKLRKAAKRARVEQLYIVLKDEDKPMVVWKKYGEEPMIFPAEEVEETILTTRPPLGGTKVVVKMVGEGKELLEVFSLQDPEAFVDTLKDLQDGGDGSPKQEKVADAHATTRILAADPLISVQQPSKQGHIVHRGSGDNVRPSIVNNNRPSAASTSSNRPSATSSAAGARTMKKQDCIAGDMYSNPLFAQGKIRYHMVLPDAPTPHPYTRTEVDGLTTTSHPRPVQKAIEENELQRFQREQEEMSFATLYASKPSARHFVKSPSMMGQTDIGARAAAQSSSAPQQLGHPSGPSRSPPMSVIYDNEKPHDAPPSPQRHSLHKQKSGPMMDGLGAGRSKQYISPSSSIRSSRTNDIELDSAVAATLKHDATRSSAPNTPFSKQQQSPPAVSDRNLHRSSAASVA